MTGGNKPDPLTATMRLRPQPTSVLRLSRKALVVGGATISIALGAALTFAMTPAKPRVAAAAADSSAPSHKPAPAEGLNGLPKDYADAPKLGPPLPGDLGRPILAASSGGVAPVGTPAPMTEPLASPHGSDNTAQQAREAARSSQLFFAQTQTREAGTLGAQALSASMPALGNWPVPVQSEGKTDPDRKRAFLEQASDSQTVSMERLRDPASPYLLLTGSVVPAALITGIRSDIPGQVLAQVTEDVRDSITGQYMLIPKGSRLIGQYDNAISYGQSRILLTWSRLILPDGKSLVLEKLSAADARGYAGLQDRTDYHWGAIVNAAAVSTLLGVGTQTGNTDNDSDLVRAIRSGAADSFNRAGQQIVERQLTVQPTITIRAGTPVRVVLSRDLVLEPYGD